MYFKGIKNTFWITQLLASSKESCYMKNEVGISTNTEFKLNLRTNLNIEHFRNVTLIFQCTTLFETKIKS